MKIYVRFIIGILLLLQLSSCDILDRYPLDAPSDANFLATEDELTSAVTACYQGQWYLWDEGLPLCMGSDLITDIGYDRNTGNPAGMTQLGNGAYDGSNGSVTGIWQRCYTYIARCNDILAYMSRGEGVVDPDIYRRSKAEAQFLRVLYYHYLIEFWGDVPLIKTPLTMSGGHTPKSRKADIVRFLLQELDEAAPYLPDASVNSDPTLGRATNGAAYALKSRIALYNELWDEAIDAAEKVMDMENAPYILSGNYRTLFLDAGSKSREIIFSVQFLKGTARSWIQSKFGSRNANGTTDKKPSYQLVDSWECTDGLPIDRSPLFNPKQPYKNRDPRLGYTLAVPGSIFSGFQFETHGDSVRCWDYNPSTPRRITNQDAVNAYATFTGVCWRKYCDSIHRNDVCDINVTVIRYAEVLLNYAEAKIEKGDIADGKALAAINKVRARKSVEMPPVAATTQTELRNAVRRERKYELSGEGFRLFDIRRWRIAEIVMNQNLLGRMKRDYPDKAPRIDEMANAFYDNSIPIAGQGESSDHKMRVVEVRQNAFDPNRHYWWPIPTKERETNHNIDKYE